MPKPQRTVEREHKYLVRNVPPNLARFPRQTIRQGYLVIGTNGRQARLREIRRGKVRPQHILTVKAGAASGRYEEELTISSEDFARLWPMTQGLRLEKIRYEIPLDNTGLTVELDVYRGKLKGLTVAEVEFDSDRQARNFEPPSWLGKQIDGVKAYANTHLAQFGLPKR